VTNDTPEPTLLETRYRESALALALLPPDGLEPDFHPWEPGGRYWRAAKDALVALRRKHARLGDAALTDDERLALKQFDGYEAGDKNTFVTWRLLNEARYLALRSLLSESGVDI
jgi:hypothetical protein